MMAHQKHSLSLALIISARQERLVELQVVYHGPMHRLWRCRHVVVQGKGRGSAGVWSGTAPAGQGTLSEGNAVAIGLAFVARRTPPGYELFSWSDLIRLAP